MRYVNIFNKYGYVLNANYDVGTIVRMPYYYFGSVLHHEQLNEGNKANGMALLGYHEHYFEFLEISGTNYYWNILGWDDSATITSNGRGGFIVSAAHYVSADISYTPSWSLSTGTNLDTCRTGLNGYFFISKNTPSLKFLTDQTVSVTGVTTAMARRHEITPDWSVENTAGQMSSMSCRISNALNVNVGMNYIRLIDTKAEERELDAGLFTGVITNVSKSYEDLSVVTDIECSGFEWLMTKYFRTTSGYNVNKTMTQLLSETQSLLTNDFFVVNYSNPSFPATVVEKFPFNQRESLYDEMNRLIENVQAFWSLTYIGQDDGDGDFEKLMWLRLDIQPLTNASVITIDDNTVLSGFSHTTNYGNVCTRVIVEYPDVGDTISTATSTETTTKYAKILKNNNLYNWSASSAGSSGQAAIQANKQAIESFAGLEECSFGYYDSIVNVGEGALWKIPKVGTQITVTRTDFGLAAETFFINSVEISAVDKDINLCRVSASKYRKWSWADKMKALGR